jgi:hypothetical protein
MMAPALRLRTRGWLVRRHRLGTAPSRRRKSRTTVLAFALAFVLAHLGLAVAVETRRPEWRDPEFFQRQKRLVKIVRWEREQGHARPLVVILGGSRPQMGLSPEHLDLGSGQTDPLVFNCAQSGCLPVGERLNLSRLLATELKPDFILIEVLPPVLADPGPMEDRIPIARLSHADLRVLEPYHTDPAKVRREWEKSRLASWSTLRFPLGENWGLADYFPPDKARTDFLWKGMRFYGWSPFYPAAWTAEQRQAQLRVARQTYGWLLDDFRIVAANDRAYRDMLEDCRERRIRAAFFTMPESPAFRHWYSPAVRAKVSTYLAELSREFGAPVFDASAWLEDETAFMDGHHLLGPAAESFSKRLGRECVGPWIRESLRRDGP